MKKSIIIAYKDWVFWRDEEKKEKLLKNLFIEQKIGSSDGGQTDVTKRVYTGEEIDLYFYSTLSLKHDSAMAILSEIKKDIERLQKDVLLLLHIGTQAISFLNIPLQEFIPQTSTIKVDRFSAGVGNCYRHIIGMGGAMFPSIPSRDITADLINDRLKLVWDAYCIEDDQINDKIASQLDN